MRNRKRKTAAALVAVLIAMLLITGCLSFDDSQPILADQAEVSEPEAAVRTFFLAIESRGMSLEEAVDADVIAQDSGITKTGYDLYETVADPAALPALGDREDRKRSWEDTSDETGWVLKGQQLETSLIEQTDTTAIVEMVGGLVQYHGNPDILGTKETKTDNFKDKPGRFYLRLVEADQFGDRRWVITSGGEDGEIWPLTEKP